MKQIHELSVEELGRLFPIILSEPDPQWREIFPSEKIKIENVLGENKIIRIEHIGSTAIPGLIAKPTIDILLEIIDIVENNYIISNLEKIDYQFIPKPENPAPNMMFVKGYSPGGFSGQAFHIHVRYRGDWDEVHFRDYLIRHPEIAHEYAELKIELAKKYRNNREDYTEGKAGFVKRINSIAKNESI